MVIGPHTRIAELIKANDASIDAIAGLAKPLRKLKNPLLRRVMASRVTIAEAAAIGGCPIAHFARVLGPLGFTFRETAAGGDPVAAVPAPRPDWLVRAAGRGVEEFDVRPTIDAGDDPLKAILQRFGALGPGQALCIVNSFIPHPLISLLEGKGALSFVEPAGDGAWHTWFLKGHGSGATDHPPTAGGVVMHDGDSFDRQLARYAASRVRCIDVRALPMPRPMETILAALPELGDGEALYVRHKRVPLHLLEALDGQPYAIHIHEAGEGDVKLLMVVSRES